MAAIALQRRTSFCRLAVGRAILLALGRSALTTFHRAFLDIAHVYPPVLLLWSDALLQRQDVAGLAIGCFRADARRASNWFRSALRRSACGRSLVFAQSLPLGGRPSVCAHASRSSR